MLTLDSTILLGLDELQQKKQILLVNHILSKVILRTNLRDPQFTQNYFI